MDEKDGKPLLKLARSSIETFFEGKLPDISETEKFDQDQGVFVTLHKHGELRGCIGFPEPVLSLYKAIIDAARGAAFRDPRFPAVQKEEMKDIEIEISVLTVPKLIKVKAPGEYLEKIKIGRDGLIIRGMMGSGLLLPQVPVEWKWNTQEFLEHTCQKAGLNKDDWKDLDNKIYSFQAEIFSE